MTNIGPIVLMLFGSPPLPAMGMQSMQPPPKPSRTAASVIEISLPALLDERYLGDLTVMIDGEQVSFDGQRFVELLRSDLTPPALDLLSSRIANDRLTPQSATTQDVLVEYNASLQEIRITTVVSARQRRIINFRTSASEDKSQISAPANISAFLTASAAYQYVWETNAGGSTGRQPGSGTIDFGGRIGGDKGVAFISRQNYQEGRGKFLQRTETQLIYDRVEDLLRVTAGDLRYRGANFQGLPRLAGVTVERFFGLEPSRVFRPIGQTAFELERSSTVDVRINGVVVRQLLLTPGRYDLRDIPLVQGANDVELVIRDDTGREQVISNRNFFDFNLLEPGLSDFSFSAGVRARPSASGVRYSDAYAFSGFYRRGLSNTVTAGIDAQVDQQGVTGGASVVWAAPLGIIRLEAAGSQRDGIGSGFAVDAGYSVTGRFNNNNWRWTAQLNGQWQSNRFSTLSDIVLPSIGELRPTEYSVNASVQVSNARWNITASGEYDKGRGISPTRTSGLLGATYSLTPQISLGAFARYADTGLRKEKGGFFQVTWRPGRNQNVRASYDTARQEALLGYRYSPTNNVGSTQADINIRRNALRDDFNLSGSLFHTGNRFEANLQHDVFTTADFSSDRIQTTRASVSNSIVLVGGKLALARPIREGFAMLSPHKSLKGKTILADPTENGARAYSDGLGPAVVPDLSSYSRSSLYIDVIDLEPGYDLGSGQFGLKAPLYAGYKLTVGSGASVTMLGKVLVGPKLEPLILTGGKMESLADASAEPISVFTNRNGRLAGTGFKPGKYRLTLFTTPPYVTEIEIPENADNLFDVGELRIPEQ
jgi:outer membrane usher protein